VAIIDLTPCTLPLYCITLFQIFYSGSKFYDEDFSQSDSVTRILSELQITGGVIRGVVENLTPGTTYTVTVAGVNGATRNGGEGMMSSSAAGTTRSSELPSNLPVLTK
jgi:cytochrome c biogenesis protein CcdA